MFRTSYFAALAVLPLLAACSGTHSLSHEELQSKYRASISLASETEAFLNHRAGHSYSAQFTEAHLSYLKQQGGEIESDLATASPEARDVPSLNALRNGTRDVIQTLNDMRSEVRNTPVQTSSVAHLDSIRQRLEADMPR